jgi:flagellar biogenesis protein FliO
MVKSAALVAVVVFTMARAGHAAQRASLETGDGRASQQVAEYAPEQTDAEGANTAPHTVYLQGNREAGLERQPPPQAAPNTASTPSRQLPPPTDAASDGSQQGALSGGSANRQGLPRLTTALAGLAFVLGAFFLFAWILKRNLPKSAAPLPKEVVEVLGRVPLAARNIAHLVRVGNKLVLVSISSAGIETLTEIADPVEVDRLSGICEQARPTSSSEAFRGVLQSFTRESAPDRRAASELDGLRSLSREVRDG